MAEHLDERRPPGAIRVVLADDTDDVRLLLRIALRRAGGFEVVGEAADGQEALDSVRRLGPDALVTDLSMPVMDGLTAIPLVAAEAPATKILVFSGFNRPGVKAEALRLGAHAYLEKGAPLDEIVRTLRTLCRPDAAFEMETNPPVRPPEDERASAPVSDALPQEALAVLVHEVSSPIAVIRGLAELLAAERTLEGDEARGYVEAILRSAGHLGALLADFAELHRVETEGVVLERQTIELGSLVEQMLGDLRRMAGANPVALTIRAPIEVQADAKRVRQVISNLVSNAAKFTPDDAPVEVEIGAGPGGAEVVVADRGAGIAEEDVPRLFQRFSQLGASGFGMGLGLYISRGIARAHGGDLVYEPRPEGGSRFILRLPAEAAG